MTAAESGKRFDGAQLPAFLEHIARVEEEALESLRAEYASQARNVRQEARRSSRRFHRRACEEARTRIESDRTRKMSRARSEFRRRRWQVMEGLRASAREKILRALQARWADADRQRDWCRFWIEQLDRLGVTGPVMVRLGRGAQAATADMLRAALAGRTVEAVVTVDDTMAPGLVVDCGDFRIDGLLGTQVGPVLERVEKALSARVPIDQEGETT